MEVRTAGSGGLTASEFFAEWMARLQLGDGIDTGNRGHPAGHPMIDGTMLDCHYVVLRTLYGAVGPPPLSEVIQSGRGRIV